MSNATEPPAMAQHRFYVGPIQAGLSPKEAGEYWYHRHSQIVPGLPRLGGYVQNRPLPPWRERIPLLACAETWYHSREDEQFSYASDYYRDTIVPDEERFIDRSSSWTSAVASVEVLKDGPPGGLRVIGIGADPAVLGETLADERVEAIRLLRPPTPAESTVVAVWTNERDRADQLANTLGGLAFVSESVAIVTPAVSPWG